MRVNEGDVESNRRPQDRLLRRIDVNVSVSIANMNNVRDLAGVLGRVINIFSTGNGTRRLVNSTSLRTLLAKRLRVHRTAKRLNGQLRDPRQCHGPRRVRIIRRVHEIGTKRRLRARRTTNALRSLNNRVLVTNAKRSQMVRQLSRQIRRRMTNGNVNILLLAIRTRNRDLGTTTCHITLDKDRRAARAILHGMRTIHRVLAKGSRRANIRVEVANRVLNNKIGRRVHARHGQLLRMQNRRHIIRGQGHPRAINRHKSNTCIIRLRR